MSRHRSSQPLLRHSATAASLALVSRRSSQAPHNLGANVFAATRVDNIPVDFQWTRNLTDAAQTIPGVLTEVGDEFSNIHGPNGRAAVLIHEAVHFTFAGGLAVDVPEWSGQTINGRAFGIAGPIPGVLSNIAYTALTTDQAIENPGSYASFAQEIFSGQDNRFGIARRHE